MCWRRFHIHALVKFTIFNIMSIQPPPPPEITKMYVNKVKYLVWECVIWDAALTSYTNFYVVGAVDISEKNAGSHTSSSR